MRLIIEARVVDGENDGVSQTDNTILAVIERPDHSLSQFGLTLSEGRALLADVQQTLVSQQVDVWLATRAQCHRCGSTLKHKDSRARIVRTIYGKMTVSSPRLWLCDCSNVPRRTFSPLFGELPEHATAELNYLQVKLAAHLPFRSATSLLKEVESVQKVGRLTNYFCCSNTIWFSQDVVKRRKSAT